MSQHFLLPVLLILLPVPDTACLVPMQGDWTGGGAKIRRQQKSAGQYLPFMTQKIPHKHIQVFLSELQRIEQKSNALYHQSTGK